MPADEYDKVMARREQMFGKKDFTPQDSIADLQPGTFYLTHVDKMYKRYYASKGQAGEVQEGKLKPEHL